MICYKDMTFCSSDCVNTDCRRNFTDQVQEDAKKWWGDIEGEPPIAFSDFSQSCEQYIESLEGGTRFFR